MSVYMTEDEQLEAIKKWWNKHGTLITVIISVILLAIAGYRYFNWHEDKVKQQASVAFERMMVAFSNQEENMVKSYANELVKNYANTVYADAAHLTLAKVYVTKNEYGNAKSELLSVVEKSNMPPLKQIAKIRIARLLAEEKSYTDALKQLSAIDDSTYSPVINELKGDIYSQTGQYKQAMQAYRLAMNEARDNGVGNLFLEMKTNELATTSQSMILGGKKEQNA